MKDHARIVIPNTLAIVALCWFSTVLVSEVESLAAGARFRGVLLSRDVQPADGSILHVIQVTRVLSGSVAQTQLRVLALSSATCGSQQPAEIQNAVVGHRLEVTGREDPSGEVDYLVDCAPTYLRDLDMAPVLLVEPRGMSFRVVEGGPNSPAQILRLRNGGGGLLSWTVDDNGVWLRLDPAVGRGPGDIAIWANHSGLPPGSYQATIRIVATGVRSQQVSASLVIERAPCTLVVDRASLTFDTLEGFDPSAQSLRVGELRCGRSFSWTASTNVRWLSLSAPSGSSSGRLKVFATTAGLRPGLHHGVVTVAAAGATGSPKRVAVSLQVRALTGAFAKLKAGWNLISSATGVVPVSQAQGNCQFVELPLRYDPAVKTFVRAQQLEPMEGYWAQVQSDCVLFFEGSDEPDSSRALRAGLNIISSSRSWNQIKGDCQLEKGPLDWLPQSQTFVTRPVTQALQDQKGYWVRVTNDCLISEAAATPSSLGLGLDLARSLSKATVFDLRGHAVLDVDFDRKLTTDIANLANGVYLAVDAIGRLRVLVVLR